jgi:hypothetical protein
MLNVAIDQNELITTIADTVRDAARCILEPGYMDAVASAHYIGLKLRRFESVAKEIPCHRITPGGKRLYRRSDLDEFMARHREGVQE